MKLAIITYILHKKYNHEFYSYEPYIREMNLWIKGVQKFIIVAPCVNKLPDVTEESYSNNQVKFLKIPQISLLSLLDFWKTILRFPIIAFRIFNAMRQAEHIHLRCPGNISLIGCFVQILFPKTPKTAKYAGNWDSNARQPWSYKLQKLILSNTFITRNIKVLVYGQWPKQTRNILPFFTASFSQTEKGMIVKERGETYKFMFVGKLVGGKRPITALKIVEELNRRSINASLDIYGEGVLKKPLNKLIKDKEYIRMHGNQPLEVVKQAYKDAHFIILDSKSEGWPKAIAEAMFFGCIPIASAVSCVPWMLGEGSRGILIPDLENSIRNNVVKRCQEIIEISVDMITNLINDPEEMSKISARGQKWSQQYTLEKFEMEIQKLLTLQTQLKEYNENRI
jgi:glycosyltransferase involved in cell wall biosynthesis